MTRDDAVVSVMRALRLRSSTTNNLRYALGRLAPQWPTFPLPQVEYGVRVVMAECECLDTICCVVDNTGIPVNAVRRQEAEIQNWFGDLELLTILRFWG